MESVTGLIISGNQSLKSLSGLENLSKVKSSLSFFIDNNDLLEDIDALSGLDEINTSLRIRSNLKLSNLYGLHNIKVIDGDLCLVNLPKINDLEDLRNLRTVTEELSIRRLEGLTSLSGLDSLDAEGLESVTIDLSSDLTFCHVKSICDFLLTDKPATIKMNASGCETVEEVSTACITSVDDPIHLQDVVIFPNPGSGFIELKSDYLDQINRLTIVDQLGRIILSQYDSFDNVDVSHLSVGMYYLPIESEERKTVRKIVIE